MEEKETELDSAVQESYEESAQPSSTVPDESDSETEQIIESNEEAPEESSSVAEDVEEMSEELSEVDSDDETVLESETVEEHESVIDEEESVIESIEVEDVEETPETLGEASEVPVLYSIDVDNANEYFPLYESYDEFMESPLYVTRYEYEILNRLEFIQYALVLLVALIFLLIFRKK